MAKRSPYQMTLRIDDEEYEESDGILPFKYSITSYGADFPVDALVKRLESRSIYIPPFQRSFVWTIRQASRFVESLLLGLPVPGIFLSKEDATQKLLVIDGQQRLRTLHYFYAGYFVDGDKNFTLEGVQERFNGLTYLTLQEEDRRRLDDSIIHATIVKQDEPSDDNSSVYHIFERLNTGGTTLQHQEIRACVYHGDFNALINQLNRDHHWRAIFGPVHPHMRDQELILRFFALFYQADDYEKPMKAFLNNFMAQNRHLQKHGVDELSKLFSETISVVFRCIGPRAFKPRRTLNAAVYDAVMAGIAHRLSLGEIHAYGDVTMQYQELLGDVEFLKAVETGTTDGENIRLRMLMAKEAFSKVG